MKRACILTVVCMLAFAGTAQAQISLNWDVTPNAAVDAGGNPLDLVIGNLTAPEGEKITAIDLGTSTNPGLIGTFYQANIAGIVPSPLASTSNIDAPEIDSHLLFNPEELAVAVDAGEDNDASYGNGLGFGTHLYGAFGILGAYQTQSVDFVQLYVPPGAIPEYGFSVADSTNTQTVLGGVVPEPGSLALLLLGVVSLLGLRRRR